MKKDYQTLFQHFEIRENRYKEQIKNLQDTINDKDVTIAELKLELQKLRGANNRLSEQIDRITKYSDTAVTEGSKPKKRRWFFLSKS